MLWWGHHWKNGEPGVESIVCNDWDDASDFCNEVVGDEFGEEKQGGPVIILVVDIGPKVLFHVCIDVFSLTIIFRGQHFGETE